MKKIIAHQGITGSFSHSTAVEIFGNKCAFLGTKCFGDIFKAVENDEADVGIIPIENSLAGSVYENYDLLSEFNLKVIGEKTEKIEHLLLGIGGELWRIKRVFSHQKGLEQCRNFLEKLGAETVMCRDTASAAKIVLESKSNSLAAIAGADAAKIYNLSILKRNISDNLHNFTRFLLISRGKNDLKGTDKCSLIFSLKHEPGSLSDVLKIFADKNLNVTKIESRPIHEKPFEYIFYLDFEFPAGTLPGIKKVIKEIKKHVIFVKVLGFYKKQSYENC